MRYALHILFLLLVPPAFAQRLISVATDTNGVISVPYTFWPSNAASAWSAWGMTNAGIPYHLGSGRFMPLTIGSGLSTNGWVLSATNGGSGSSWTNLTDIPSAISALSTNNGAALTNLNGTEIRSGTVAEARIDSAIARDAEMALLYQPTNGNLTTVSSLTGGTATNFLAGDGTFKQVTTNMVPGLVGDLSNLSTYAGTHLTEAEASALYQATNANLTLLSTNNASSLTNLNASNLASGTVPDARLSSAVALTNSPTIHTPSIIGATTQTGAASNQVSYGAPILYAGTTNVAAELALKKATRTGVIREVWIPANAMSPGSDTPTASTNIWATTTDGQRIETWDFSATSTNSLYFTLTLPQAWDGSTVKAKVHWKQVAAEANTTNVWALGGGSINDGEEGGNTLGTLVTVLDQGLNNTNQVAISAASSAITIGGTPSAGHLTWFTVKRHPGDSSDNMTVLSRLFGVHLQFTETSTEPSAW